MHHADADRPSFDGRDRTQQRVRRVLMTADAVGGVWRYAVDLSIALRQRGVEVTLAVMGPTMSAAHRAMADSAELDVVGAPFKLEWQDEAWPDIDRAGAWLLDLERAVRPDVVHLNGFAHGALPWQAPAVIVAHSCVCSWWRAVRGSDAPPSWDEYRHRVTRGLAGARIVAAPTAAMLGAIVREYGWVFTDARVIPNGVQRSTPTPDSAGKARLILAAGRLWDEGKNIAALCAAAPAIEWPIYVAGEQRGPSYIGAPVSISPHVCALGSLDARELERWFDRASIYALPAKYEPFGLSILEAAHAKCALVLGDIASLRETWEGAALFVPPDDRSALTTALTHLIEDRDVRLRMGALARGRAGGFTLARAADAYLRAYTDACTTSPTSEADAASSPSLERVP